MNNSINGGLVYCNAFLRREIFKQFDRKEDCRFFTAIEKPKGGYLESDKTNVGLRIKNLYEKHKLPQFGEKFVAMVKKCTSTAKVTTVLVVAEKIPKVFINLECETMSIQKEIAALSDKDLLEKIMKGKLILARIESEQKKLYQITINVLEMLKRLRRYDLIDDATQLELELTIKSLFGVINNHLLLGRTPRIISEPEELKKITVITDPEVAKKSFRIPPGSGIRLQLCSDSLKDNYEVVAEAIKSNSDAIFFASERLQHDPEILKILDSLD